MNLVDLTPLENSPAIVWVVNNVIFPVIVAVVAGCILWILFEKNREATQIKREKEIEAERIIREEEFKRKDKLEREKAERCKELEGFLRNHSNDLVNDVLSKWFDPRKLLHIEVQNLHSIADTPLAKVIYEPPNSSIIGVLEFYNHKSDVWEQAVSHLRAEEYIIGDKQFMAFWFECETQSDEYLNKNLKVLENIKNKVLMTSIPQKFSEWDGKGTSPPTNYILDNTVYWIYQEAKHYVNSNKFHNIFKKDRETERGYIRIGSGELCAKCLNEGLADEFIETVYGIAKDKTLTDEIKLLKAEKKNLDDTVQEFKEELLKIIDDFEKGYYILKCTCDRCKPWVDKLKSLNESYYRDLISPD